MNSGSSQMIAPQPQFALRHTLARLLRRLADRLERRGEEIFFSIQDDDFLARVAEPARSVAVPATARVADPHRDGESD